MAIDKGQQAGMLNGYDIDYLAKTIHLKALDGCVMWQSWSEYLTDYGHGLFPLCSHGKDLKPVKIKPGFTDIGGPVHFEIPNNKHYDPKIPTLGEVNISTGTVTYTKCLHCAGFFAGEHECAMKMQAVLPHSVDGNILHELVEIRMLLKKLVDLWSQ
jgi:hypothetical protein